MRFAEPCLELASYQVRGLKFADFTAYRQGILQLNPVELQQLLLQDDRLEAVGVHLAAPGSPVRITQVLDATEARIKADGASAFAGIGSAPLTAGTGRTNRLAGMAIVASAELAGARVAIIDMSGPGADASPFGRLHNLVLAFRGRQGLSAADCDAAMRQAAARASHLLAGTTLGQPEDQLETFQLTPVPSPLPKVVYVCLIRAQETAADTFIYGRSGHEILPTLIHPNEILDGAIVAGNYGIAGYKSPTYSYVNHPLVRELYRRHGQDLDFLGVVVGKGDDETVEAKLRTADYVAKLARLVGADGVIIMREAGGHTGVSLMAVCQQCERHGLKTVLMTHELAAADGSDYGLVDAVPEADAIISVGNVDEEILLPAMETVVGGEAIGDVEGTLDVPASASFTVPLRKVYCATNQLGLGWLTTAPY